MDGWMGALFRTAFSHTGPNPTLQKDEKVSQKVAEDWAEVKTGHFFIYVPRRRDTWLAGYYYA